MKKILVSLFSLLLILVTTVGLASCGDVEFKVDFVVDGEIYDSINTKGKETLKIPSDPTKEAYSFDGWYWDNGTWQKPFTANSLLDVPLTQNMSVYAKWLHIHVSSDWIEDTVATCKVEGAKHKECTDCGEVLESDIIERTEEHTPVIDERIEPSDTQNGLTEGSHCSICEKVLVEQTVIPALLQGTAIKSTQLNVYEDTITGSFSNTTDTFSFLIDLTVGDGAEYIVARDIYCENVINSKTVPLEIGDNTFYVLVTSGKDMQLYTVTIRRLPMYTVTFNANGGTSVQSQTIEEGGLATAPTTARAGYTFTSWDYDFSTPIMNNTCISAFWTANTNTEYRVEYYLQNLEDNEYTVLESETENLSGTTDSTALAEQKAFDHFNLNRSTSTLSGNINGDGSLVLKLYYTRNMYSLSNSNKSYGSITNSGRYKYGNTITSTATVDVIGCEFIGWYSGEECLSNETTYSYKCEKSVEARFAVKFEMQGFNFSSTSTTCTITGIKDRAATEISIPDYVTCISDYAFEDCASLTSINASESNTEYKSVNGNLYSKDGKTLIQYAIGKTDTSFSIPNGVTTIGKYAFSGCTSLASVTIPDSVTSIGKDAFDGCSIENATIPTFLIGSIPKNNLKTVILSGGESIANYAFEDCTSLTSVTIPDSVTSIGWSAFWGCTSLASVTIPDSVTYIDNYAFSGCTSLTSVTIPDSVTSIGYGAFGGCNIENATIPTYLISSIPKNNLKTVIFNGGESIANYAFEDCTSLTSVTIPDSVTSIGKDAFYGCSIENATLPTSLIGSIPKNNLKTVIFNGGNSIGKDAFNGCRSLTSVTIPDSVTSIGYSAFEGCTRLASVNITDIAKWCEIKFDNYSANPLYYANKLYLNGELITELLIPNGVTSIGNYAFYDCTSLTSVTIPDSVTSIGGSAFSGCTRLASVTIGNGVESIGSYAFSFCCRLVEVINKSNLNISKGSYDLNYVLDIHNGESRITNKEGYIFYTAGGINYLVAYRGNDTNLTLPVNYNGENYVINYLAFYGCTRLASVTIPDSVTSIGSSAFSGCSSLASVTIGDSVTSISSSAFSGCSSLTSINASEINTEYKSVNGNLYSKDGKTLIQYAIGKTDTSFAIPNGVTTIGEAAFEYCTSLTSVTIPDSVTSIGKDAFYGCNIENATIPTYLISSIPKNNLKTVIFNGGNSIGRAAFYDCTSLTSVTIGDSVTSIDNYAFSGCTNLTSVTIGDSVTSIGASAFSGCTSLTSVTIPDSVTSIGYSAFEGCTRLTSVTIPDSVTSIGDFAFYRCTSLTIYCEAESEPSGWSDYWNYCDYSWCPVIWGYMGEE